MKPTKGIGRVVAASATCKDCGKVFVMDASEVSWYVKKELQLPKRCKACRKKRRDARQCQ